MKDNKLLYSIWALVVGVVILILNYNTESSKFYGIADTREIVINAENAVEIKNIHVVPGQTIGRGELLVDFDRPDLTLEINNTSHQLEALRANRSVSTEGIRAQIDELKALKAAKTSEIDYQIKELQAQYALNKELASGLRSIETNSEVKTPPERKSPIQIKIESLQKALALAIDPLQIKIDTLARELVSTEDPFKAQEEKLKNELNLLLVEKNRLYMFSPVAGIIGSVNVKKGEKIAPFTPLLTLHPKSPSWVRGYVHENMYNQVTLNQRVTVVSSATGNKKTIGEVIGVGSRIVEFPVRLRKRPDVQVWGREIEVKIPADNSFLLGEKVLIMPAGKEGRSYWARLKNSVALLTTHARDTERVTSSQQCDADLCDITAPSSLEGRLAVEASGVTYLNDLKKYFVVSDDTENKKAVLYLMNDEGIIEDETDILGLESINDMEAITEGRDGDLYVACSQSYNKKDRLPQERKLLVRLERDKAVVRLAKKIYLFDLLAEAAKRDSTAAWAQFITSGSGGVRIDIEGIFYYQGSLYLGFKAPLKDTEAVIVKIENIDRVLEENALDEKSVSLWRKFALEDHASGAPTGISDLYLRHNRLYILSYARIQNADTGKDSGNLWAYDMQADQLSFLTHFEDLKPEGITFNPDKEEFLITFDHGDKHPSKIMRLRNLS